MIKFIKWLLCLEPKQREYYSKSNHLIMNENGGIRLNTDNPEVLKGIHKEMMKYVDIK